MICFFPLVIFACMNSNVILVWIQTLHRPCANPPAFGPPPVHPYIMHVHFQCALCHPPTNPLPVSPPLPPTENTRICTFHFLFHSIPQQRQQQPLHKRTHRAKRVRRVDRLPTNPPPPPQPPVWAPGTFLESPPPLGRRCHRCIADAPRLRLQSVRGGAHFRPGAHKSPFQLEPHAMRLYATTYARVRACRAICVWRRRRPKTTTADSSNRQQLAGNLRSAF